MSVSNTESSSSTFTHRFEMEKPLLIINKPVDKKELASDFGSVMMILKAMVGLGIFALPHTAKYIGYGGYAIMYPMVSILKTMYVVLVIRVCNKMNYRDDSYGKLHAIILGNKTRWITDYVVLVNSLTTPLSLIAASMTVAQEVFCSWNFSFFCQMTNTRWIVYTIFVYLTTIPFSLAQNLKRFVWINTVCITFAVLCLSYIIIDSLFVITEPELRTKDPLVFFSFSHFLKFFGIANFSLEGVNLIIPIQSQMRRPKKFNFYLILTTGFDVLRFGNSLKDLVFLNFISDSRIAFFLIVVYSAALYLNSPFSFFPTYLISEELGLITERFSTDHYKNGVIFRFLGYTAIFLIIAMRLDLGYFIELSGILSSCSIGSIIPVLIYVKFYKMRNEISKPLEYLLYTLGGISVILSISAFFDSIYHIRGE